MRPAGKTGGRTPRAPERGSDVVPTYRDGRLGETPALTEAQLHALWLGQRFPPSALTTQDGHVLRVVYRGRPAGGAGPDFRDAIIALPDATLLKGDVELHVRASDFQAHGHHRDLAYNNLILHIVFVDNTGCETRLANGRTVPVVVLGNWVARRAQELERLLQQPPRWQEPCHTTVARLGETVTIATLERLGLLRFRAKAAAFTQALQVEPADQAVYRALLCALGYGGSAAAGIELAERLPWRSFRAALADVLPAERPAAAQALLLEMAGLAPGPRSAMDAGQWRTRGIRPENHPTRRLAGGAILLTQALPTGPAAWMRDAVEQAWVRRQPESLVPPDRPGPDGVRAAASRLIGRLTVPATGRGAALIGRERAIEIAMNVVLPFAFAWGDYGGVPALKVAAEVLARALPVAGPYGITKLVYTNLRGGRGRPLVRTALCHQGLLYLSRNYCTQGGCGTCPLS